MCDILIPPPHCAEDCFPFSSSYHTIRYVNDLRFDVFCRASLANRTCCDDVNVLYLSTTEAKKVDIIYFLKF